MDPASATTKVAEWSIQYCTRGLILIKNYKNVFYTKALQVLFSPNNEAMHETKNKLGIN